MPSGDYGHHVFARIVSSCYIVLVDWKVTHFPRVYVTKTN